MNTEHTHIYTAEDIKKYLEGKLTPTQMHAMEKAALNDSFLAEAIEGYENHNSDDWQIYLQDAKQALAKKQTEAKVIPISTQKNKKIIWRVAAAVLLISGLGIAYNLINKNTLPQQNEVAKNKSETTNATEMAPTKNTAPIASNQNNKVEDKAFTITKTDNKQKTTPLNNTSTTATQTIEDVAISQPEKKQLGDVVTTTPPAAPVIDKVAEAKEDINFRQENTIARSKSIAKSTTTIASNYNFISQVYTSDNTPLPFANITVEKDNFGTYADVKGNFRLHSTDSFVTVLVKSVGYQPRYYTLNHKTALNKIVLQDAAIDPKSEVVVTTSNKSKNLKSRKAVLLKDSIFNIEPKDGWTNYSTYIANNIDIPDDIGKDFTKGRKEVEVSFDVSSTGAITNVKVDNANCNGCDTEAVKKAIQQGPQWKPTNGRAGSAKIKVQF